MDVVDDAAAAAGSSSSSSSSSGRPSKWGAVPGAEVPGDRQGAPSSQRLGALVQAASEKFLAGWDCDDVDYDAIDANGALDDMDQIGRDAEDAYFDY